jgi:hypothetical protein
MPSRSGQSITKLTSMLKWTGEPEDKATAFTDNSTTERPSSGRQPNDRTTFVSVARRILDRLKGQLVRFILHGQLPVLAIGVSIVVDR